MNDNNEIVLDKYTCDKYIMWIKIINIKGR